MQIQLQSIKTPCRRLVLEVKLGHECVHVSSIVDIIHPQHDMKVRVWTMWINTWLVIRNSKIPSESMASIPKY